VKPITVVLWLSLIVGCAGEKRVELNNVESKTKEAIGRFRLGVPETLKPLSRTQLIYGVEVAAAPVVPGAWDAKVGSLGAKILSRPSLGDGVAAVWYKDGNDHILEASALRDGFSVAVLRDAPAGKEAVAEKLTAAVLSNYKPGSAAGFCLGPGAIHMGPSLTESVRINWEQPLTGVKLDFSTRTVTEPDTKTFMDVKEESDFARMAGGSLTVLLERDRTVAGLAGREIRIVVTLPGQEPQVRYTWHYPGVERDGTKPKIDFVAKGPASAQAQLESIWEAMLPSLESVPVS
jgi:hypothetical protein